MANERITWVECPRDAMQGVVRIFPTEAKVRYLKQLMHCGFDIIDIGSFVSPRIMPQMADSAEVIRQLAPHKKGNRFLVICANKRGVDDAIDHPSVDIIGFPFSLSETFQQRNTKRSREEAIDELKGHAERIKAAGKSLVVYISMAFGNPYGEAWDADELAQWAQAIQQHCQPEAIALSDTVAKATASRVQNAVSKVQSLVPESVLGLHMHVSGRDPLGSGVIQAGWEAGIRRFDTALLGFGGCPMAQDSLCGNLPTEALLSFAAKVKATHGLSTTSLESAHNAALAFF